MNQRFKQNAPLNTLYELKFEHFKKQAIFCTTYPFLIVLKSGNYVICNFSIFSSINC